MTITDKVHSLLLFILLPLEENDGLLLVLWTICGKLRYAICTRLEKESP